MTTKEISDITAKQSVVFNQMQTLDDVVSNNHNVIVKVAILVGSLYDYTHQSFKKMRNKLKNFKCHLENEISEISYAMQCDRMMNKLHVDLVGSIVSIFNHHPTPFLLPIRILKVLMKENKDFFVNIIYLKHGYLVYHYDFIFQVLPMQPEALRFILRLPRIIKPSLTSLYLIHLMIF